MNKQIEEMQQQLIKIGEQHYEWCVKNNHLCGYGCEYSGEYCAEKFFAEALYNAGYCKVGDNEVVIDKGFFDDLIAGNVTRYIKETDNIIISKKEYENSRKETATVILKPLYEKALNSPDYIAEYHISDIQELAEEFGIEVE